VSRGEVHKNEGCERQGVWNTITAPAKDKIGGHLFGVQESVKLSWKSKTTKCLLKKKCKCGGKGVGNDSVEIKNKETRGCA
jgi:hypothetical protein